MSEVREVTARAKKVRVSQPCQNVIENFIIQIAKADFYYPRVPVNFNFSYSPQGLLLEWTRNTVHTLSKKYLRNDGVFWALESRKTWEHIFRFKVFGKLTTNRLKYCS